MTTGALTLAAPLAASALAPGGIEETFSFTSDDLCSFPVSFTVHTVSVDRPRPAPFGGFSILRGVETDRLDANGKTVQGVPYSTMVRYEWDSQGDMTSIHAQGESFKFIDPNGRVVTVAGRANWLTGEWTGSPNVEDWAWACAALAP
jgi:hypothetical protein